MKNSFFTIVEKNGNLWKIKYDLPKINSFLFKREYGWMNNYSAVHGWIA